MNQEQVVNSANNLEQYFNGVRNDPASGWEMIDDVLMYKQKDEWEEVFKLMEASDEEVKAGIVMALTVFINGVAHANEVSAKYEEEKTELPEGITEEHHQLIHFSQSVQNNCMALNKVLLDMVREDERVENE